MGYSMSQHEADFHIKNENFQAALMAIHAYLRRLAGPYASSNERSHSADLILSDIMEDLPLQLRRFSWDAELNGDGDICYLRFDGDRLSDEDGWMNAIAPYVDKGSYIVMIGEDGAAWKWYFDGKSCESYPGELRFPNCPDEQAVSANQINRWDGGRWDGGSNE